MGFDEEDAVAGAFFAPNENEILAGGAAAGGGGGGADIEMEGNEPDGRKGGNVEMVEGQLESSSSYFYANGDSSIFSPASQFQGHRALL